MSQMSMSQTVTQIDDSMTKKFIASRNNLLYLLLNCKKKNVKPITQENQRKSDERQYRVWHGVFWVAGIEKLAFNLKFMLGEWK